MPRVVPQVDGAVVFDTSRGPLVFHLYGVDCPQGVRNLLGLCEAKYFNGAIVTNILRDNYLSIRNCSVPNEIDYSFDGLLTDNPSLRVKDELDLGVKGPLLVKEDSGSEQVPGRAVSSAGAEHAVKPNRRGLLMYDNDGRPHSNSSRLLLTLSNRTLTALEGRVTIIGELVNKEGYAVLDELANASLKRREGIDTESAMHEGPPLRMIRIRHTIVLHNPFLDEMSTAVDQFKSEKRLIKLYRAARFGVDVTPTGPIPPFVLLGDRSDENDRSRAEPEGAYDGSPLYNPDGVPEGYLSSEDDSEAEDTLQDEEYQQLKQVAQQSRIDHTRSLMLQLMDQIPDATMSPPENVLFVCKLNPLTESEDLATCFRQFGKVQGCDIIKDRKTGKSLRYAFVEYETKEQAERAFLKMDQVLIDDSRIHVDFCQSVAGVWQKHRQEQQRIRELHRQQRAAKRPRDDQ